MGQDQPERPQAGSGSSGRDGAEAGGGAPRAPEHGRPARGGVLSGAALVVVLVLAFLASDGTSYLQDTARAVLHDILPVRKVADPLPAGYPGGGKDRDVSKDRAVSKDRDGGGDDYNDREQLSFQDQARDALRREIGALVPGRITYNPPRHMRVGREEMVTVRIGRTDMVRSLTEGLAGSPSTERIRVGNFMRVHLRGGAAFRVDPDGPQDLALPDDRYGEWSFRVTPLQEGPRQILELAVFVRIKLPGSDEQVAEPVLRREIAVEVAERDLLAWIVAHLEWVLGAILAILVPLAGYFLRRWWEGRGGRGGKSPGGDGGGA